MKALILCAGLGTRLWSLTKSLPKPMIEIGGKPCLEHIIFHLSKFGMTDFMINLHYKPEVFMKYFGDRLIYSYEPVLLGEEGTIDKVKPWFEDYMLVANGDTLTDLDIPEMFRMSQGKSIQFMDGNIYAGTKILSPTYLSGIDKRISNYYSVDTYWQDIGTPEGLERARKRYERKNESTNRLSTLRN